jgi:hypothetical protein
MANSKNTIQNIPLLGSLNLNTLKTDVKQFEGYNEKNSTVFGGELGPIWQKKDTNLTSYSADTNVLLFNNKGKNIRLSADMSNGHIESVVVYSNYTHPEGITYKIFKSINLNEYLGIPNVEWAAAGINGDDFYVFYKLTDAKIIYKKKNGEDVGQITLTHDLSKDAIQYFSSKIADSFHDIICLSNAIDPLKVTFIIDPHSNNPTIIYGTDSWVPNSSNSAFIANFGVNNGSVEIYQDAPIDLTAINNTYHKFTYNFTDNTSSFGNGVYNTAYIIEPSRGVRTQSIKYSTSALGQKSTIDVNPFTVTMYVPYFTNDSSETFIKGEALIFPEKYNRVVTGHNGLYKVPGVRSNRRNDVDFYTVNNQLATINFGGIPITSMLSYDNNRLSISSHFVTDGDSTSDSTAITYKNSDNEFIMAGYTKVDNFINKFDNPSEYLKSLIIDKSYILLLNSNTDVIRFSTKIFDINNLSFIEHANAIGYIFSAVPIIDSYIPSTNFDNYPLMGAVYGGGFNAGFEINGAKFTGYLPNPSLMTGFRKPADRWSTTIPDYIQTYCTVSSTVQSAEYNGEDNKYEGTYYPIQSSNNIILPYNLSSEVISGYTNNDMIFSSGTAYPLIYYNNTQKIYSYFLLSAMENVKHTFSLQGQRYAVDDDNIFAISFDSGIISNVVSVVYKKNLEYIGTLPTRSIFYSKLNKTFYQFTGDNIISKMMEASYINEIFYIGQNPSTLSLWICTDRGIYIISDTDMYKLDFITDQVFFQEDEVILITEEGGALIPYRISLYSKDTFEETTIKLKTAFYGLGNEQKAGYDCWYVRLHSNTRKAGKLKMKINTITDSSFQTEEQVKDIVPAMYDDNDTVYIKFQPNYQSAVATQLELESDIPIYQISLGVNQLDTVAQQAAFNF